MRRAGQVLNTISIFKCSFNKHFKPMYPISKSKTRLTRQSSNNCQCCVTSTSDGAKRSKQDTDTTMAQSSSKITTQSCPKKKNKKRIKSPRVKYSQKFVIHNGGNNHTDWQWQQGSICTGLESHFLKYSSQQSP